MMHYDETQDILDIIGFRTLKRVDFDDAYYSTEAHVEIVGFRTLKRVDFDDAILELRASC